MNEEINIGDIVRVRDNKTPCKVLDIENVFVGKKFLAVLYTFMDLNDEYSFRMYDPVMIKIDRGESTGILTGIL